MDKLGKIMILIALSAFLVGCTQNNAQKSAYNESSYKKMQVFFYYETGCPNCKMIEPYMKFLKKEYGKEIDFHFCNWDNRTKWSNIERKVFSETNPYGFPAVVVINGKEKKVYIGWYAIGENFTAYLNRQGYKVKAFYNKTSYNVAECLNCHAEKHIPPPSKYNCTYCCHMHGKT